MKKLTFVTGNKNKLAEVQKIIPFVVGKNIDLPEIQESDAKKVISAKLLEAYKHQKGEYIVEDTSLYLSCLNNLPGPLIKWFWEKLKGKKIYEITKKLNNQRATAKCIFGHINSKKEIKYYEGVIKGKIVKPIGKKGFAWDTIFQPDNHAKTFAQMSPEEKNSISMRRIALDKLSLGIKKDSH